MFKEFKEFAMKGNVFDMAIGIVIGAAFGKIVSSFVGDVLMPPLGKAMGNVDFSALYINLSGGQFETLAKAKEAGAVTINYGLFLGTVLDFLIVAFAIFLLIKGVNRMRRNEIAPPPPPNSKECPHCFLSIPIKATKCGHCTSSLSPAPSYSK